jgi:hypothetical protein
MSGDEISFPQRKLSPKKIMSVTFGAKHPSYSTAKNHVGTFRTGHLSSEG